MRITDYSKKTTEQAFRTYFLNSLSDVCAERNKVCFKFEELHEVLEIAVKTAVSEMDDPVVEYTLHDHCVHWLVDLVVTPEGGETAEFSVNLFRLDPDEVYMLSPILYLNEYLKGAMLELEISTISPGTIHKVSKKVEEYLALCPSCDEMIVLQEVVFKNSAATGMNAFFCFRIMTGEGAITFEVPWPQV